MDELGRLIHEAIDRGMVAAGWRRCTWAHADVFERPEAPPFVLRAQYWVDDTSGQVQALLSLTCLAADAALAELAEDLVPPLRATRSTAA
jgi:hypothetical protein